MKALLIAAGGLAVVAVGIYVAKKGLAGAAAGVVGAVADAASGTVIGIGKVFGIPETSESECDAAIREGRTWDASFACHASRFAGHLLDKLKSSEGATRQAAAGGYSAPAITNIDGRSFADLSDPNGYVFFNPGPTP